MPSGRRFCRSGVLAALGACALLLLGAASASADTFTVVNGNNTGAGSLRQAISDAESNNNDPVVDQIQFDSSVTTVGLDSSQITITHPVTIDGPGADSLNITRSVSATAQFRFFAVVPSAGDTITIRDLSISGARASAFAGGAVIMSGLGNLALDSVVLADNRAPGGSGGALIYQRGFTSIRNSTLNGNQSGFGGAIVGSNFGADVGVGEVLDSTISGNSSEEFGGGIYLGGTGRITVNSSTIQGNMADSDNTGGGSGGGTYNASGGTAPIFSVANTLYAGNTVGTSGDATTTQCGGGAYASSGYNLRTVSEAGCTGFTGTGEVVNAAPMLGSLGDNGGPTPTIALLTGSPAINAGNPATPTDSAYPACPATDERALPRGAGGNRCDIGAFEVQRNTTTTAVACAPTALTLGTGSTTCIATVTDAGSNPTNPTGSVNFSSNGIGTFSGGGSCSLVGDAGQPSCQVTYTPTAVGSGSHQITGAYTGDANHDVSQGVAQVAVVAPAGTVPLTTAVPSGRAAAIKKCKKKFPKGPRRKKCIKKAKKRFPA